MQHFHSVKDVNNLNALVRQAMKIKHQAGPHQQVGSGKTIVMLFFNPSLRTRLSTIKAAQNLGLQVITMNAAQGWQIEFEDGTVMDGQKAEHVREAARVISLYADLIGIRTFPTLTDREKDYAEFVLQQFTQNASVPVLNMESATVHPLQSLADLLTIREHQKITRPKVVLSWAPHPRALPQAVANSFVEWMKRADVELAITHPAGYELAADFVGDTPVLHDQDAALEGADFVYAKNWSSYRDYGKILRTDRDWLITSEKMAHTNEAFFMHCLPVRRNVVVTDEVIDGKKSLILKQAENREYAAQAVLEALLSQQKQEP